MNISDVFCTVEVTNIVMSKVKFLVLVFVFVFVFVGLIFAIGAYAKPVKDIKVFFIVKASTSDYWQIVKDGGRHAAEDYGIQITFQEPAEEREVAKQVAILNTAILTHPDAIVIAPTVTDSLVPGIEKAMDEGIKVIIIDSSANTKNYVSFLASNNYAGGKMGAGVFASFLKRKRGNIEGRVGVGGSLAGVNTQRERIKGFLDEIKAKYPGLKPLPVQYNENDIVKAMSQAKDMFTAHPKDLVGIFGANDHCADGVVRAIETTSGIDISKMVFVGFDADPMEVAALKKGILDALIVQRPWDMGYDGVVYAISAVQGVPVPKYVDTGLAVVTKENMSTVGQAVLNPIEYHKSH